MKTVLFLVAALLGLSCAEDKVYRDKTSERAPRLDVQANQQVTIDQQGSVILPMAIFAADFNCEYDALNASELVVVCALHEAGSSRKLQLLEDPFRLDWSAADNPFMQLMERKTGLSDPVWHVSYKFRITELSVAALENLRLNLRVYYGDDQEVFQTSTIARKATYSWRPVNGLVIPEQALIAGTQSQESIPLYLCRLHYENAILPGKLRPLQNQLEGSACLSFFEGQGIASQNLTQTSPVIYKSDVLVLDADSQEAVFSWVPAANGAIPDGALIAGYHTGGEVLHICRALEAGISANTGEPANLIAGELTPGYIYRGRSNCTYEFDGIRSQAQYEVLVVENRQTP